MFARSSLSAFLVSLSLISFGCKSQPAPQTSASASATLSAPTAHAANAIAKHKHAAESAPEATAEPDDATMLARKTSEYASNMSNVLAQHSGGPTTRASIVQWVDPAHHPVEPAAPPTAPATNGPAANQPASLAAAQFKQDASVPLILPESADQIPPAPAAPTQIAQPAPTAPVSVSTDDYELKLHKLVQDYPRDLGNQLDYQLLRLVRDEPTPDLSDVSQLSSEDRDLLMALMDGLTNFRAAVRGDSNQTLNRKIHPLIEMAERLRSQGQLSIPTVAFCTQVSSFGVYRPMASSRFPAGRANDLIVYCEAANFTSVRGNDTIWRTRLRQEIVLYTDSGLAVWPDKSNSASFLDQSRNRRHDFFISRMIRLPATLAAGKYLLKITLTDEESNRVVEATAPLEIISNSQPAEAQPAADHTNPEDAPLAP